MLQINLGTIGISDVKMLEGQVKRNLEELEVADAPVTAGSWKIAIGPRSDCAGARAYQGLSRPIKQTAGACR